MEHIEPGEEFFLCFVPELIGKEGNIEASIVVWSLSYLIIVVESNLRKYEKVEIHPQMSSTPKERGISLLKFLSLGVEDRTRTGDIQNHNLTL